MDGLASIRNASEDRGGLIVSFDYYAEHIETCRCPKPPEGSLGGDLVMAFKVCEMANKAKQRHINTLHDWILSEEEAHKELEGSIK